MLLDFDVTPNPRRTHQRNSSGMLLCIPAQETSAPFLLSGFGHLGLGHWVPDLTFQSCDSQALEA